MGTIVNAIRNAQNEGGENLVLVLSQDLYESTKYIVWGIPISVNPTLQPNTFYIGKKEVK